MLASELQKFTVILLFGSLVLQSFIVLANPMNVNKKANLFFGLFLFLWSSFWFFDVIALCGLNTGFVLTQIIYILQIFTPLFLYFSVVFFINPNYVFKKADLACLILPVIYITLMLDPPHNIVYSMIPISHNLPYIAIVYFKIRRHQKRIETISSNTENSSLQWLIKITSLLFVTIIITEGYELYNIFIEKRQEHLVMDLLFLIIVYLTSYYSLRQKEIYPLDEAQRKELLEIDLKDEGLEEKKKLLSDNELENLKLKLTDLMETEKPYLDGELNLIKLAGLLGISAHQLSYLINQGFDENFFQFVNGYRVRHAQKLLSEKKNQFSLLGIAYESGFNSKTSFNTIFKKMTQQTPSEFRKGLK
jgi:AraC-like DNA-binding protein